MTKTMMFPVGALAAAVSMSAMATSYERTNPKNPDMAMANVFETTVTTQAVQENLAALAVPLSAVEVPAAAPVATPAAVDSPVTPLHAVEVAIEPAASELDAQVTLTRPSERVFFPHLRRWLSEQSAVRSTPEQAVSIDLDATTEKAVVTTAPVAANPSYWDRAMVWAGVREKATVEPVVVEQFEIRDEAGRVGVNADAETAELISGSSASEGAQDWLLTANVPVADQVAYWSQVAGWKVRWSMPEATVAEATVYRGRLDNALEMVLGTLYANVPVRFVVRESTKTIEVVNAN